MASSSFTFGAALPSRIAATPAAALGITVGDSASLDIVANFGDQFSDLIGGHSQRAIKLPNPTYYLP